MPPSLNKGFIIIYYYYYYRAKRITKPSRTAQEKKTSIHSSRRQRLPSVLLKEGDQNQESNTREGKAEFKSTAVIPYIKEVPEPFRRHLQQQEIRTVFKSDTTLRSRLVRQKDPADPNKQDGVVYKIRCTCGKVYIGETGRSMQERMKEHDSDI